MTFTALIAGGIGWSLAELASAQPSRKTRQPVLTTRVVRGTVGQTLDLVAAAAWPVRSTLRNMAVGVATSVTADSATGERGDHVVDAGSTLYSVNLHPVVAAVGAVPAFRDLRKGDQGEDVVQLQRMLMTLGLDPSSKGKFDAATERAVRTWQDRLGERTTGEVPVGQVMYFPTLPARVRFSELSVGADLTASQPVVQVLAAAPTFTLTATSAQNAMIASTTDIELTGPGGSRWSSHVSRRSSAADGSSVVLSLSGPHGEAPCGRSCAEVPVGGSKSLAAKVVVVPTVHGAVVPSAAVQIRADGSTIVQLPGGRTVKVHLVAEANAMAVVEGVAVGQRVRIQPRAKER